MVKDSELATNYAMYWGTWVDADNNSELIVAMADSGDEVRFDLYQDGSIEASGFVQFSQEYSGDYFYNEFDGWAHHCWLADDGTLQIEGFGGFEKDASASDMDASDTGDADAQAEQLQPYGKRRHRAEQADEAARQARNAQDSVLLHMGRVDPADGLLVGLRADGPGYDVDGFHRFLSGEFALRQAYQRFTMAAKSACFRQGRLQKPSRGRVASRGSGVQ